MSDEKPLERLASLLEKQIAVQLHFGGANQNTIARVLNKSKGWVNDLLRGVPKKSLGE
ncbi:MAG TPA: hypothetical protein VN861_08115 [Candidatus Acidoferrales bacterium]|nr:hypothetical protein [Candidatus Acidoferrales bacterium]